MKTRSKYTGIICALLFLLFFFGTGKQAEASSMPVKITSARVLANGRVSVRAKVRRKAAGKDGKYYLVKINGLSNRYCLYFGGNRSEYRLSFVLGTEDKANIISKLGVAVKKGKKLELVSNTRYVKNPEAAASYQGEYTLPATKKGIHWGADVSLGAKHTLVNMNLNDLITTEGNGEPYVYNGKTYYFTTERQKDVQRFVSRGVCVTMVVYMNWSSKNKYLIYPTGRHEANYWYMFNTSTEKARETLEAAFCYLGEKFSEPKRRVSNWVLGNEVNSPKQWNHAGSLSFKKYVKAYAEAFQMLSDAVHTSWAGAHIFVPLDNAWNIPISVVGWNGKTFLTEFAQVLKKEYSGMHWNLAYHAYSFPLTEVPYKYNQYVTKSADSPYITPQNLHYLTDYIRKKYGSDTRLILSEQGYMASMGEKAQAASLLYSYYIAEFNPMVDAFIMRCEYDDAWEVSEGYPMGLSDMYGKRRQAYKVFKYMDTPRSGAYAKRYLKTVRAKRWQDVVPGYRAARFKELQ